VLQAQKGDVLTTLFVVHECRSNQKILGVEQNGGVF